MQNTNREKMRKQNRGLQQPSIRGIQAYVCVLEIDNIEKKIDIHFKRKKN